MAMEIIWGKISNQFAITALIERLNQLNIDGTLYLGYPILASADSSITVEALLVSETLGLVAFNFPNQNLPINELRDMQDKLGYAIEANLSRHENLRVGRNIGVKANIVSYFGELIPDLRLHHGDYYFVDNTNIEACFSHFNPVSTQLIRSLQAAIQRVTMIKPQKKRENVLKRGSRGAILKIIEKNIANLDEWQKKAAIETPEGPQRVRGLAGSGKTIVLALKAAYLHAQHPEWDIVVTFNTLSLSQQFTDLIERFSIEHSGDKPNWEKLQIRHAWGSYSSPGVYSKIAAAAKLIPMDYTYALEKYGRLQAFEGLCAETLAVIKNSPVEIFDAILIDEAQDFPASFFRLIYEVTKQPKRIIWAYDELQNLSDLKMLPISEIFGDRISLNNEANSPQRDIILPICYRNTPWALALAHALGFGIYRNESVVQLFDELSLWRDIGYEVVTGSLDFDSDVVLRRRTDSYPDFFNTMLNPSDAIIAKEFDNEADQYEWVSKEIKKNIEEDELDPDDILIILPDVYRAKQKYPYIAESLQRYGINSHLAGVSTTRDIFIMPNSVTVSGIYRAKGNEAAMVYVINSDYCVDDLEKVKRRNILFTAITRSRAWVRICGIGANMHILMNEIKKFNENNYTLSFHIPTQEGLLQTRLINRDRTLEEQQKIRKVRKNIEEITRAIDDGSIFPDDLPKLEELLKKINKSK